ncbi:hypothetical protein OPV22_034216 [Ensete ventricosum]|uniref:Uncharacterized protein n=1 Tax=Ensete ventricosum TaxID=4639 RepID=A0AAV8P2Z4_ENSVE|nr:hypothetical protein OPV22_034216 [Ensete ventricosum]
MEDSAAPSPAPLSPALCSVATEDYASPLPLAIDPPSLVALFSQPLRTFPTPTSSCLLLYSHVVSEILNKSGQTIPLC